MFMRSLILRVLLLPFMLVLRQGMIGISPHPDLLIVYLDPRTAIGLYVDIIVRLLNRFHLLTRGVVDFNSLNLDV
jgi:hypothetical protein